MINYISSIDETDKFIRSIKNDCTIGHNYKPLYNSIFLSDYKLDKILEIGTSSCGFAKFLKDNQIGNWLVGADLKRGIVSGHIPSKKIWPHLFDDFYEGDVSDPQFIEWIKNKNYKFDLAIDDASHEPQLQKYLLNRCNEFLSDQGVYVMEDIRSYDQAKENLRYVPAELRKVAYIVDLTFSTGRFDDICIVVDKRAL